MKYRTTSNKYLIPYSYCYTIIFNDSGYDLKIQVTNKICNVNLGKRKTGKICGSIFIKSIKHVGSSSLTE